MDILYEIDQIKKQKKPKSSLEKLGYAGKLVDILQESRERQDMMKWVQAMVLYYLDEYNLWRYVWSKEYKKREVLDELGMAYSTAQTLIRLWKFYVVEHNIKLKDLVAGDTYKLMTAISSLRDRKPEVIQEIVDSAEKWLMPRSQFITKLKEL